MRRRSNLLDAVGTQVIFRFYFYIYLFEEYVLNKKKKFHACDTSHKTDSQYSVLVLVTSTNTRFRLFDIILCVWFRFGRQAECRASKISLGRPAVDILTSACVSVENVKFCCYCCCSFSLIESDKLVLSTE